MTPLKQLLRQPVRLIAVLLLLSTASAFFSLSVSVYASARKTLDIIESSYVTIGIPSAETAEITRQAGGMTGVSKQSVISREMWAFMDQLAAEGSLIKGICQQKFISAYSPDIQAAVSSQEDNSYSPYLDAPYNRAVFVVRILDEPSVSSSAGSAPFFAQVTAEIEDVICLHPGYTTRRTLHFFLTCRSEEEYNALAIAPGKKYVICGENYVDHDLELRTSMADSHRCSVQDIDLSQLSFDLSDTELEEYSGDDKPVAVFRFEGWSTYFSQYMLDQVDACSLSVIDHYGIETGAAYSVEGVDTGAPLNECYLDTYMTALDTDFSTFLTTREGKQWQKAIEETQLQYQTISVIGTDLLEGMYCFHERDSFVAKGRSFSQEEYLSGARVCLISETTALKNGLDLGDEITLSYYWSADPVGEVSSNIWKMQPQTYSCQVGMSGEGQTYTVIGIYRQLNAWDTADYRFLPNTIFVPNASLPEVCYTGRNGALFSYILHNGMAQELQALFAQQGYPENILFFFDNGYTGIADSLRGFYLSTEQLLLVACLVSLAVLLVFIALFVNRQSHTAGLMLSLGQKKRQTRLFLFKMSVIPILFSCVTGTAAGTLLVRTVAQRLLAAASDVLPSEALEAGAAFAQTNQIEVFTVPASASILTALGQLLVFSAVVYCAVSNIVKKPPRSLIKL